MMTFLRKTATCLLIAATVLTPTLSEAAQGFQYFRMYGGGQAGSGGPVTPPPQGTLFYQISGPSTARVGQAYAATSLVTGATGQTAFALRSGALPPGLTLDGATGAISGVPTQVGSYSAVIGVQDSTGAQGSAGLGVNVASAVQIAGSPSTIGTVGTGYAAQFSATGGNAPYVFSTGSTLPPGLSLSPAGLLSGTPSAAGDYGNIVVRAEDAAGATASSASFQIRVASPVSVAWTPADGEVGISYATSLPQASGGRAPYLYSLGGSAPAGLSFSNATGSFAGTPLVDGSYQLSIAAIDADGRFASTGTKTLTIAPGTIVNNPGPLALSANPPATAQVGIGYAAHFFASGGSQTGYVYDLAAGTLPAGLALDPATGTISGSPTTLGTTSGLTVRVTDSAAATATFGPFSITVAPQPALIVAGNPSSSAQVGVAYSAEFTAFEGSGGGYSFSSAGNALPEGLTLANVGGASAQLTGVPTRVGTYSGLKIRATDSGGHTAETSAFTIVVAPPAGPALAISGSPAGSATVGTPYSAQLSASGGSGAGFSFALAYGSVLPSGLSLDPSGAIGGAPTTPQTVNFTVQATDSAGDLAQSTYTITVSAPLVFAGAPSATNQGASYLFGLSSLVSGGRAPYSFALVSGALPDGMSLQGAAVQSSGVSGSTSTAVIRATDADARVATASLTFVVDPAAASATLGALVTVSGTGTVRAGRTISGSLSTNISNPTWSFAQSPSSPVIAFAPSSDGSTFSAVAPGVSGPTDVTVTATAANGAASLDTAPFTVRLLPQLSVADAGTGTLDGVVGLPFSYGPYAYSGVVGTPILQPHVLQYSDGTMGGPADVAGTCPGLSVDTATGTISGIPSAPCGLDIRMMLTDTYDGTIVVHGSASSWPNHLDGSGAVYVWLANPAPHIAISDDTATASMTSSSHLRSGAAIAGTLSTNMTGATWSFVQSPSSPDLGLAASGNSFSGVAPPVASVTVFGVQATATLGAYSKTANATLTVAPPLSIAAPAQVVADAGVPVSASPDVVGLGGMPTYALLRNGSAYGALSTDCAGLSFSTASGVISGTPSATCSVPGLSIRVTDSFDGAVATSATFAIDRSVAVSGSPSTGAVGEAYSFVPAVTGGTGSFVSFAATNSSGSLAALGLALNATTGAIVGTPSSAGTWQGTISATDSHGNVGTSPLLTLTVAPGLSIVASTTTAATAVGETFAGVTVTASGSSGTKTYSLITTSGNLGTLGLSFSGATGAITGAPTAQGVWTGAVKVVTAGNPAGAQTDPITITVNPAISIVASATSVATAVGEAWSGITVTVSGGAAPYTYSAVDTAGTLAARGLSIDASTGAITGTPTSQGTWTGKIRVTDPGNPTGSQTASITITVNAALSVSASTTSKTGYAGEPFAAITMTTTGGAGAMTYSEVANSGSLAALGLTLSPTNGAISGPPTTTGTWTGAVKVVDPGNPAGAQTAQITITVNAGLAISGTLPAGTTGASSTYSFLPTVTGGSGGNTFTVSNSAGSLSSLGLQFSTSTGAITNTSAGSLVAGTWTGAITVADSVGGSKTLAASITVSAPLAFAGTPPTASQNTAYSYALTGITSGGRAPYSYAITSGSLPGTNLTLSSAGIVNGTPTTTGTSAPTIQVTDADGRTVSTAISFTVAPPTSNAWAWGTNSVGQLGNGNYVNQRKAVAVTGGKTYVKVAAGQNATCGITNDGNAQCWGTGGNFTSPQPVTGYTAGTVTDIAVGSSGFGCLIAGGTPRCWNSSSLSTAPVTGWSGTATKIAMYGGSTDVAAVRSDGTVMKWTIGGSATQVAGISGAVKIAVGNFYARAWCIVTTAGAVKCWGDDISGMMGDGAQSGTYASTSPSTPIASGATDIAMGYSTVLAVVNGGLKCWGQNIYGECGLNSPSGTKFVTDVTGYTSGVTAVALSMNHACFIQNGSAYCMGDNTNGDLGDNTATQRNVPVAVQGTSGGLTGIAAGYDHSAAF